MSWLGPERVPPIQKKHRFCLRCNREVEACQGLEHRGVTDCMECGGGLGDVKLRHCLNCVDLPNRVIREKASGKPIVYTSEMTDEQLEDYQGELDVHKVDS